MKELKKKKKKKTVFSELNVKAFTEGSGYHDQYAKTDGNDYHAKGYDSDDFSDVLF
jgi:peptide methionine sulfoxide reductase MsrA